MTKKATVPAKGKVGKAKAAAPKAKRAKKQKAPFRVMIGHLVAGGKYAFSRSEFQAADEAMAEAQKAIDGGGENLREILILINPEAAA